MRLSFAPRAAALLSMVVAAGAGLMVAGPCTAVAQSKAGVGLRMAYVDMQRAILETEEGKNAKSKIEKEAEAKKKDLLGQQNDLKKLDDELQAQSAVLSEDAKSAKQKEFQNKLTNLQKAQMGFEQDVRAKEMQETQKIFQNISDIISEVAKKKGYDMVFERGSGALLYAAKIDDLTTEVVSQYNLRHKVSKK